MLWVAVHIVETTFRLASTMRKAEHYLSVGIKVTLDPLRCQSLFDYNTRCYEGKHVPFAEINV